MANTTFFTQCENCVCCGKDKIGWYCEKFDIQLIPNKDGCTWGMEREVDNERKAD